jgi:hypothetical protein
VSGPAGALIVLPTSQNPQVKNLVPGAYVFQVKVTDNKWRTAAALVTITISGVVTQPPPRTVATITMMLFGVAVPLPLTSAKITYSDGTIQG